MKLNVKATNEADYWMKYLLIMQSCLPKPFHLTEKEREVLGHSIVISKIKSIAPFSTAVVEPLSEALGLSTYAIRMHRKNIRNKGWIVDKEFLEPTTARLINEENIDICIHLSKEWQKS